VNLCNRIGDRGDTCPTGLCALLLLTTLTPTIPANAAELKSPTLSLTLRDGVIVGLKNRLSGESFVTKPATVSLPVGLHQLGAPLFKVTDADETSDRQRTKQFLTWSNLARFELRAAIEPTTGDVIITQTGEYGQKKIAGISWGISDIPDRIEVLVPGCSGQRFSTTAPAGRREFNFPMTWEASFVLIQGREGGFLIRADDDPPR